MATRDGHSYVETSTAPPPSSTAEARNLRQKARACGLSPDYWYIVARAEDIAPGQLRRVRFWRRPIVVFRSENGEFGALEDCCAHRQVRLSAGTVQGSHVQCMYHGWTYDRTGRLVGVPHETFGRPLPAVHVPPFPVKERYGMVWVFPGDPRRAEEVPLPDLPELEGPEAWACVPMEYEWPAHHSMVLDNVSDYTHGWLHRAYEPFRDAKLLEHETVGDVVRVRYSATIAAGRLMSMFVRRADLGSNQIELRYQYPYSTSNTDDFIKHFISVLPEDERTSRVFFLLYYRKLKVPFLPLYVPRRLMVPLVKLGNRLIVDPVFAQDGAALALEQEGYERAWQAPAAEMNPIVRAFQELTIRKWEEYQAVEAGRAAAGAPAVVAPRLAALGSGARSVTP